MGFLELFRSFGSQNRPLWMVSSCEEGVFEGEILDLFLRDFLMVSFELEVYGILQKCY